MTAINEKSLALLRGHLPTGYGEKVRQYLPENKREISKGYLSAVLHGKKIDTVVLEALVRLSEDYQGELRSINNRIDRLKIREVTS